MFLGERLIAMIAPHLCVACGREGQLLCEWCAGDAFPAVPSRCYRCKQLTKHSVVCKSCRSSSRLRHVWVATNYGELAKELLKVYKFGRACSVSMSIAKALDEALPYLPAECVITFVPTATSRLRQRGYDQAELVAKDLARLRGRHCMRVVTRLSQTRQVGANKAQRSRQLRSAFTVVKPHAIKDKILVVVDDVTTTGSTLEAMATVLR